VNEAEQSLRRLGIDYVDLYLVHWPQGGPVWAWPAMERSVERGLARSIGVSQERIRENAQIFDFTLSPEDMAALDALDRTKGTDRAYERNVWRGALRRVRALIPRTSLLRPG
jgi:diketogulonate reductase-like aldo/keto reductase